MKYFFDTEFLEDGSTIDLISIGIVAEDGRELYREVDMPDWLWGRIYQHEWLVENVVPHLSRHKDVVRTLPELRAEINLFVSGSKPEFWAYCGAYDWVVLNQLYGPMVAHPKRWKFYACDIAQERDRLGLGHDDLPKQEGTLHNALADARWVKDAYYFMENLRND